MAATSSTTSAYLINPDVLNSECTRKLLCEMRDQSLDRMKELVQKMVQSQTMDASSRSVISLKTYFNEVEGRLKEYDNPDITRLFSQVVNEYTHKISLKGCAIEIPRELVQEIFLHLGLAELGKNALVCRTWLELASDPEMLKKVIYFDRGFSKLNWEEYFGKDIFSHNASQDNPKDNPDIILEDSLPPDIIEILKSHCPVFKGKSVNQSHMLVWLPEAIFGTSLTINKFVELIKKYYPENEKGFRKIWKVIVEEIGKVAIGKSRWVLMTKYLLPGSENLSYASKSEMVVELNQKVINENVVGEVKNRYKVPGFLVASVCIFSQYLKSQMYLLGSRLYTSCQERVRGFQLMVGGFTEEGLDGDVSYCYVNQIGITALRELSRDPNPSSQV